MQNIHKFGGLVWIKNLTSQKILCALYVEMETMNLPYQNGLTLILKYSGKLENTHCPPWDTLKKKNTHTIVLLIKNL